MAKAEGDLNKRDEELREVFANNVAARAKASGLSTNMLADFAGMSRSYLSAVLRQEKAPTLRTIAAVAYALEVEPWELLRPEAG